MENKLPMNVVELLPFRVEKPSLFIDGSRERQNMLCDL